jgi:hypothetical protein
VPPPASITGQVVTEALADGGGLCRQNSPDASLIDPVSIPRQFRWWVLT